MRVHQLNYCQFKQKKWGTVGYTARITTELTLGKTGAKISQAVRNLPISATLMWLISDFVVKHPERKVVFSNPNFKILVMDSDWPSLGCVLISWINHCRWSRKRERKVNMIGSFCIFGRPIYQKMALAQTCLLIQSP